jgi:hypothetical protein
VVFSCVMSIPLITRRAVAQRWITARRAFRHIDTLYSDPISGSGPIIGSFGSLAPPLTSIYGRRVDKAVNSIGRYPATL